MLSRLIPLLLLFAAQRMRVPISAATPEQIRERVGIYIWGNVPDLSAAVDDARSTGADRVVRAFIGPWSDTPPYHDDVRPLAEKVGDAGYQKMFREYQVIMLTAYDSYSYGSEYGAADSLSELQDRSETFRVRDRPNAGKIEQPSLGIARHLARMSRKESREYLQRVKAEFADFTYALARHARTFIISNWEAENDVPDAGYWPWFHGYLQARLDGILEGRARALRARLPGRVFTAFEFTIIPEFTGRPSGLMVLGRNLRGVDYMSYSSWWSIGSGFDAQTMQESFREALRRIRGNVSNTQRLIIGEFGEYWNAYPDARSLRAIVDVSLDEHVEYLFNWVLYDQPGEWDDHGRNASHFGKFTKKRILTPQGRAVRQWVAGAETVR